MAMRDDAEPGILRAKGSTAATIYKGSTVNTPPVANKTVAAAPLPQAQPPATTEHAPDPVPGFVWIARSGDIPGHWERESNQGKTPPPAEVRDHRGGDTVTIEGPNGTVIKDVPRELVTAKDEPGGQAKIDPEKVKAAEEAASKVKASDKRPKPSSGLPPGLVKPLGSGSGAGQQSKSGISPMMLAVGAAAVAWIISES